MRRRTADGTAGPELRNAGFQNDIGMSDRSFFHRLFPIVSILGALYLATEAILLSFGTSICATEGCKVVAQYSRFGDRAFVLAGLAVLILLAGLSVRARSDRAVNALLIAALAAEGFLAGYQLFWLSTICVFCLSVLGIFVLLGALRTAAGHGEVLAGFGALALLVVLFAVVLPPAGTGLPKDAKLVLFYSAECKHCTEIRKEIDASGIEVTPVLIGEYASTLKSMGIEEVPTLYVNGPYERVFLTGTAAIRRYLASCCPDTGERKHASPGSRKTAPAEERTSNLLQLYPAPGATGSILNPAPDTGLCKEEQKCD
jgi:hypothetical protein